MYLSEIEKRAVEEFITKIKEYYKSKLKKIILYGSRARGDAEADSDIDLLIVLKETKSGYDEIKRINSVASPICLQYNLLISAIPVEEEEVTASYKTIFIENVLKEGVVL